MMLSRPALRRQLSTNALRAISEATVQPRAYRGEQFNVKALASFETEDVKLQKWRTRAQPEHHNPGQNLLLRPFDPKTADCLQRALHPIARQLNLKVGFDHKENAIRVSPLRPSWKDDKKAAKPFAARQQQRPEEVEEGGHDELAEMDEMMARLEEDEMIARVVAELSPDELVDARADEAVVEPVLYTSPYEVKTHTMVGHLQVYSNGEQRTLQELLHKIGTPSA